MFTMHCFPWLHKIFRCFQETQVVYHLHGRAGRSTVWANGAQNSGLVNFVPESRLSLHISVPFTKKLPRRPEPGIKDLWLWRNGTRISVWNIPSGKTGLPFQMFRCSRKFSDETTQKVLFHLLSKSKWIFRKILVNGKRPQSIIGVLQ